MGALVGSSGKNRSLAPWSTTALAPNRFNDFFGGIDP